MPCSHAVMDLLFPSTYCDAYVCVSVCTSAFSHFHLQEFIILQAACLYLSHAPRCFVQRREIHTYACSLTRMHAASSYFLLINDCGANQNACNSSIPSDCLSSILGFSPQSCLEHILKCFDLSRKHAGKRKGAFFFGRMRLYIPHSARPDKGGYYSSFRVTHGHTTRAVCPRVCA